MNTAPILDFLDYPIYSHELHQLDLSQKKLINTINQYSFCIAEQDDVFKKALQGSDILLPDGMAIVAAIRILKNIKIAKIAGAQLHHFILSQLNNTGGSCFYLGASDITLNTIKTKINREFPKVKVHNYSPPFKAVFSEADNKTMIEIINAMAPDVLFIGMTAPKQEKWAFEHKELLQVNTICSIGAVFDFYAGTVKRPSPFWIALRLEWFIRLLKEPKRMWKRYLYYGPVFIGYIFRKKLSLLLKMIRIKF